MKPIIKKKFSSLLSLMTCEDMKVVIISLVTGLAGIPFPCKNK